MKELNLIPYNLREERNKKIKTKYIAYITVAIFCVIILNFTIPTLYINQLKKQEDSLRAQLKAGSKILDENKSLLGQINDIKLYTDKVDLLSKQRTIVVTRIQDIQKQVPSDVIFQGLTYSKDGVNINASTVNYNSINEFAANLQTSKLYKSVKLNNINSGEKINGKYTFSVLISY